MVAKAERSRTNTLCKYVEVGSGIETGSSGGSMKRPHRAAEAKI